MSQRVDAYLFRDEGLVVTLALAPLARRRRNFAVATSVGLLALIAPFGWSGLLLSPFMIALAARWSLQLTEIRISPEHASWRQRPVPPARAQSLPLTAITAWLYGPYPRRKFWNTEGPARYALAIATSSGLPEVIFTEFETAHAAARVAKRCAEYSRLPFREQDLAPS